MYRVLNQHINAPRGYHALYSGQIEDREMHGYGKRVITSDQFKGTITSTGMWARGVFQGVGQVVLPNGDKATGQFISDGPNGVGRHERTSGEILSGQFKGGKMHGFGTHTPSVGGMLIGWWVDGMPHGNCLAVLPDGTKEALTFEHGELVPGLSGLIYYASLNSQTDSVFRSQGRAAA
jgi:hypothetical protein